MNIAVLKGHVAGTPETRKLPSGKTLAVVQLSTVLETGNATVPVVVWDPPEWLVALEVGAELIVVGSVKRRFYSAGTVALSRVEVESRMIGRAINAQFRAKASRFIASALNADDLMEVV